MGYSCRIIKPDGTPYHFPEKHSVRGGMYAVGGTTEAWMYITYNYKWAFRRVFPDGKGLDAIHGKTVAESISIMQAARSKLDLSDNKGPTLDELIDETRRYAEKMSDTPLNYSAPPDEIADQAMGLAARFRRDHFGEFMCSFYTGGLEGCAQRLRTVDESGHAAMIYWDATEVNAYRALTGLLALAIYAPGECIWEIE